MKPGLLEIYPISLLSGVQVFDTLALFVIAYLCTIAFASFANYISCDLAIRLEMSVNRDLRQTAFRHLQTLSFSYFNQNSVGYIHARLISDTSRIGSLVSWSLIDFVWRITYLVGAIGVMLYLNPKLAGLVLIIVPVLVILFSLFQGKLIHVNREAELSIRPCSSQARPCRT